MTKDEKKNCYLCNGSEFERIKGIVRDNKRIKVYKCKNCSLISLGTTSHINDDFYEQGKMRNSAFNPKKWEENAYPDDLRRYKYLRKQIKNKTIIDFGCGIGGFIKLAKPDCKAIYGVELEERIQTYLNEKGFIIKSDINEIAQKADFITMFHVLEHIEDPINLLKSMKNNLKEKSSQIIIEVPNGNDALLTLYKSKAFSHFTWWSCHLYTFNKKNLKTIAQRAGYRVNYIKNIQRYGLTNHLYWLLKGKPGGHLKYSWLNISVFDKIYAWILSLFDKTDTIIMSISPI